MKKKLIIMITIFLILGLGIAFFFASKEKKQEKKEPKQEVKQEEKLESYKEDDKEYFTYDYYDESGMYSEEEIEQFRQEAQVVLDDFYRTMFTFEAGKTGDYTEQLASYHGQGGFFDESNMYYKNIYPLFEGIHMNSTFDGFTMNNLRIRKDTKYPEISVMGTVETSFKNDKIEQGDYSVYTQTTLMKMEDGWKIFDIRMNSVFNQDKYKIYYVNDTNKQDVFYQGKILLNFDITDVDGFITDYKYDFDWKEEDYEEY